MFIDTETNTYPLFPADLLLIDSSIDLENLPERFQVLHVHPMPELETNEKAELQEPAFIGGKWVQEWIVSEMTEQEAILVNTPPTFQELKNAGFASNLIAQLYPDMISTSAE